MSANSVLSVIDRAAQRAIEERDQHDANNAPEYADGWESLRADLREARATVERMAAAMEQIERLSRMADPKLVDVPAMLGDIARKHLAAYRGEQA